MKWIDYRERLEIGFNDSQKFVALKNIICSFTELLNDRLTPESYKAGIPYEFYIKIGEPCSYSGLVGVRHCFQEAVSMKDLISKYVAFSNTSGLFFRFNNTVQTVCKFLPRQMDELNIPYELVTDEDGTFIFPKGAKELDDALVSQPLEWLKSYPQAHKTFCIALRQYNDGVYIRDIADNLRKALEAFLQEFLHNEKNLETNKNEICKYLGEQGVDAGISGLFQPLINSYKNINDRIAKHNDAVDKKLLEFLLYQTGVLIRMVIVVSKEAEPHAD